MLYIIKNTKKARVVFESMGYELNKITRPNRKAYFLKPDGDLNVTNLPDIDDFDYLRFTNDSNKVLLCDKSHYKTYKDELEKIKFKQLKKKLSCMKINKFVDTCNEFSKILAEFSKETLSELYQNSTNEDI